MGAEIDRAAHQVGALAEPGQGRCVDLVPGLAQQPRHPFVAPAAMPGAVNQNEGCHGHAPTARGVPAVRCGLPSDPPRSTCPIRKDDNYHRPGTSIPTRANAGLLGPRGNAVHEHIHSVAYYRATRRPMLILRTWVDCSVGVWAMRCTACGAEVILTKVVADPAMVRGLERHMFVCLACHAAAHRVVFTRHGREDDSEPMPIHEAPPTVPAKTREEQSAAPRLISRVIARIRGHY